MALKSGTMTYYGLTTPQTTGSVKMDLDPIIRSTDPTELPLKEYIGYNGFTFTNMKFEILEKNHAPIQDSIGVATNWNNSSIADLPVTDASAFCVGDIIQTIRNETLIVNTVDEANNDISVIARADLGSIESTAHVAADVIYIIGSALTEGWTPGSQFRYNEPARKYNYGEEFVRDVIITDRMKNTAQYGITDPFTNELIDQTLVINKLLEQMALYGGGQAEDGTNPSTTEGVMGTTTVIGSTTNKTNEAGVSITLDKVMDGMQLIYNQGGNGQFTIMLPPYQKRQLSAELNPYRRDNMVNTKFKQILDTIECDFGMANVLMNRYMRSDDCLIFKKENFMIGNLQNSAFALEKWARTAKKDFGTVSGIYGVKFLNEEHSSWLWNFSTS